MILFVKQIIFYTLVCFLVRWSFFCLRLAGSALPAGVGFFGLDIHPRPQEADQLPRHRRHVLLEHLLVQRIREGQRMEPALVFLRPGHPLAVDAAPPQQEFRQLIWNDLCLGEQRIGTHTIYFFMLISPARGRKRTGPGRPAVLKDGKPGEGVGLFDDESL